ncbi:MAG: hypothetical protein CMM10_14760 [Rhodospirillaceae bacterium]|nr:hypothetical protein [Rhodospirillaceae bacterium]
MCCIDREWESHHLLLAKGEHQTPEYFKLNPKGVVPTLLDDGKVIRESTIITEYLNETYPEPALMPATSLDRAKARLCPAGPAPAGPEPAHLGRIRNARSYRRSGDIRWFPKALSGSPAGYFVAPSSRPPPVARKMISPTWSSSVL